MKPYGNKYYRGTVPIWFGVGASEWYVGGAVEPGYVYDTKKYFLTFINNAIQSNDTFENVENNNVVISWRKMKKGELSTGITDYAQISVNGEAINSTYNGSTTFTANVKDSPAEIGRCWQWDNENRTMNGSIKMIRVYNRPLNDEEVKTNYEIDKYRFNIQ